MPPDSNIQARIRLAVSAGDFHEAAVTWEAYAEELEGEIRAGSCPAARLSQVRELIDWTRGVAICTRAHAQRRIQNHLTKLHAAAAYGRPLR